MPQAIPEFEPGTRYFIWRTNPERQMKELIHIVILPDRSHKLYRGGGKLSRNGWYDAQHVERDQQKEAHLRNWVEVTREGFILAQSDSSRQTSDLPGYTQYLVTPLTRVKPPRVNTNHKIGVPKHKLP